jgi:diguanylate cyclase (GGDEF)-like protein
MDGPPRHGDNERVIVCGRKLSSPGISVGRWVTPAVVLVLGLAAMAAVTTLQLRSNASKEAQLTLANIANELNQLQNAPFRASRTTGGSPALARNLLDSGRERIEAQLAELNADDPPKQLGHVAKPLRQNYQFLERIYRIGASGAEYGHAADVLARNGGVAAGKARIEIESASDVYAARAASLQRQAMIGSSVVIVLLLLAFGYLFRRSAAARATAERFAGENERLLAASRHEARTDALTQLPNRRALVDDLTAAIQSAADEPFVFALFDLNGFKQYNDTFGHPAGDALLARLAESLGTSLAGRARAYRMGGDEFCMLAPLPADGGEQLLRIAREALSEHGEGFSIGSSYGAAHVPHEASVAADALRLADQRLYEHKAGRASASRQSTDVLLTVLGERSSELHDHLDGVGRLARLLAKRLGLPDHEVTRIGLAAELHDIGKMAIPDAILLKPSSLDDEEWNLVKKHTEIGERIVRAAPSIANAADLIRSSHEHYDGSGYPDGLRGEEIPFGATIIAICDAYDAMTSGRPYRRGRSPEEAMAELRRCAGTQFRPDVVEAFVQLLRERELQAA